MKKIGLIVIGLVAGGTAAHASMIDSLGISSYKGKPVILHLIQPKETYYSIGRKYNVSPTELMDFNNAAPIRIGDTIKVNKKNLNLGKATPAALASAVNEGHSIEHTVIAGETMFAISRKYGVTADQIRAWNGMADNNVQLSQKLRINPSSRTLVNETAPAFTRAAATETVPTPSPQVTPKPTTKTARQEPDTPVVNMQETLVKVGRESKESGLATWISDNDLNQAKSVALHHSVPMGTIVKVTNPMTNKSVYVKVVGNFPESAETKNVLIVISKSAASLLGVKDQKFRVDLSYAL